MELSNSPILSQSDEKFLNNEQMYNQNNPKKVDNQFFIDEDRQDNRNSKKK